MCMLSYGDAHGDYVFNVFKERNASVGTPIQRCSIVFLICKGYNVFIPFHEKMDAHKGTNLRFKWLCRAGYEEGFNMFKLDCR